jgi:molybdate transport system substrate-binding protein
MQFFELAGRAEFRFPPARCIAQAGPVTKANATGFSVRLRVGQAGEDARSREVSFPRWTGRRRLLLAAMLVLAGVLRAAAAETVQIAAASDLVYCLDALNAGFKAVEPSVEVQVSTGSSGNFFAQIQHGAPYDVFLSADLRYPRELVAAGYADGATLTPYAIGRIVLWTTRPDLDLSTGLGILRGNGVKRFAIANPDHAPYGRAAKQALERAALWEAVASRLVLGENISQTAQFIETGNADAGVVALSLVLAPRLAGVGRYVEIPSTEHEPLEQGAVLTRHGAANGAARRYLAFLKSKEARAIFDRFGFRLPD